MCLFRNGAAARPGLEEGLASLRNLHQSLTKWDPQVKTLLGDESQEWREWGRECCAVGSSEIKLTGLFLHLCDYFVFFRLAQQSWEEDSEGVGC